MKKKPTPKQTELFDLSSIPVLTKEQFKESLKQEFIQNKAPAIVPQKPLRGDRFIYYRENERPLQLAMDSGNFKPYPKWAFPPIGGETEVIQLLYSSNRIGIDFEFYPGTLKPSIIGVASPTHTAACRWKGETGAVTKALQDAVSRGATFVGHFVLGADKLVLEKALGIETPHTQWDDSMIRHYLCYAALTKSPGKTESEGALGFMNLGSAAHLWLGIPNWKSCLYSESRIMLPGGKQARIKDIVDSKYSGKVLTYDLTTQKYTEARVTNWYATPNNKELYQIGYKYGRRDANLKVTPDHKVLVKSIHGDSWLEAKELTEQHQINTGTPGLSRHAKKLLAGMLLGDSHVTKAGDIFVHGCCYEYQELKRQVLGVLAGSTWTTKVTNSNQNNCYNFKTNRYPVTREIADMGRLEFAKKNFSLESLALWYLDDGYLSKANQAEICCNWLTLSQAEYFVERIKSIGIDSYIPKRCYKNEKPRILFTVAETKKLSNKIKSLVPLSMSYKLLPEHRYDYFCEANYWTEEVPFYANAIVKKLKKIPSTVYCIDVEGTHNFVTYGGVVHNCRGNHCTGPCPKMRVFDYCAVDAWAGLRISDLAIIDMERKGIPERVYTEHAEIAWEFCLTSEKHGIKVDVANLEKVDKEIETKKEALFPKDEGGNYSKFNPKSNIQVVEYFNKNGIKLKDNRKQTILDLCTIIADDYGYETLKDFIEVPPENRPELTPIEQDLMDLFMFKDSGKGVDPWFGPKYLRNGFIHPRFNFTGASTMRFSSSGPNYQNIGAHGWGAALKRLIIPRSKKYKLLSADAANLELRTVLHESGIDVGHVGDAFKWLVEQSSGAFKSPAEELGKTERDLAKIASHASDYLLGLALLTKDQLMESRTKSAIAQGALVVFEDWIYHGFIVGFTGSKLAQMLYKDKTYASRKKVLEIQKIYFDNFPSIREWHRKILRQAELGFVQTCWGDYLELIDEPHKNAKVAAAKIGQGLGAVYVQGKMLEYLRKYPNFRSEVNMIGQVHDEIIWEIPYDWDDLTIVKFCDILYKESHRIPGFKCPWSIKVGDNWGTMRKLNREEILKGTS